MASYLPGVQDYIPHLQPFQPDLNFYAAALEKKESQYKEGYNRLSSIYGTLLNSPMLGKVDNETRDKFFKDIQTNIQKISTLDLSLEENQDAAYKVFQPLIEDSNITKNIAWTKNLYNEQARGESLRNCLDEKKCGGRWTPEAARSLKYQAEDFAEAADRHMAASISNPTFTPYINDMEFANSLAKAKDIKAIEETVKGGYIHKFTNGQQLIVPLRDYFMGIVGSNPQAMAMYDDMAYVARKDKVNELTGILGNKDAAESQYLSEQMGYIEKENQKALRRYDNNTQQIQTELNVAKSNLNKGIGDPEVLRDQINNYNEMLQTNESARSIIKDSMVHIDKNTLLGADKSDIRRRVDHAYSGHILASNMDRAARDYSAMTAEHTMTADPYGLKSVEHSYKLNEMQWANHYKEQEINFQKDKDLYLWQQEHGYGDIVVGNEPAIKSGMVGTYLGPGSNPAKTEYGEAITKSKGIAESAAKDYNLNIYNQYKSIIDSNDPSITQDQKTSAKNRLLKIFGSNAFEEKSITFKNGSLTENPEYKKNWMSIYSKAFADANEVGNNTLSNKNSLKESGKVFNKAIEGWTAATSIDRENNKRALHVIDFGLPGVSSIQDKLTPEVKDNIKLLLDKKFNIKGPLDFKKEWLAKSDNYDATDEDASNAYTQAYNLFAAVYNNPKNSFNDSENTIAWNGNGALHNLSGAVGEENALVYQLNDLNRKSDIYNSTMTLGQEINTIPEVFVVAGGNKGFEEVPKSNERMKEIFKMYLDDLKVINKPSDKKQPLADVTVTNITGSNKDLGSFNYVFSKDWVNDNIASKTKIGLTLDEANKLSTEGLTVIFPTIKTNNKITNHINTSLTDAMIQHKDIYINGDYNVGNFVMHKKTADGILVTGTINTIDQFGRIQPKSFNRQFGPEMGGQTLEDLINIKVIKPQEEENKKIQEWLVNNKRLSKIQE